MAAYRHQRATGPATVLAIGKANPPTAFPQSEYPDFFFDITNCNDKTALKAKFARICKFLLLLVVIGIRFQGVCAILPRGFR